jgi:choline kinase
MGGEEMMLAARGGRVLRIARRVDPRGDEVLGEGVGFLKLRRADQPLLRAELERVVAEHGPDREYEEAIDRLLGRLDVRYEQVADLPWTEVDFPEDLARARGELLPEIERLD